MIKSWKPFSEYIYFLAYKMCLHIQVLNSVFSYKIPYYLLYFTSQWSNGCNHRQVVTPERMTTETNSLFFFPTGGNSISNTPLNIVSYVKNITRCNKINISINRGTFQSGRKHLHFWTASSSELWHWKHLANFCVFSKY